MPVTIKDVARESGVNVSTVSRALNGEYGVHADTREHVQAVAQRLRYRPNRVARGLVTGKSHTLGLVVSDIRNMFFTEVARGAEDAAYRAGTISCYATATSTPKSRCATCSRSPRSASMEF